MRRWLLGALMLVSVAATPAGVLAKPAKTAVNGLYGELGGAGVLYSINYERWLLQTATLRVGLSILPSAVLVPVTGSYMGIGNGSHALELGGGLVTGVDADTISAYSTAIIGWRFAPESGGVMVRVAYTPLLNFSKGRIQHWGGVAVGYRF